MLLNPRRKRGSVNPVRLIGKRQTGDAGRRSGNNPAAPDDSGTGRFEADGLDRIRSWEEHEISVAPNFDSIAFETQDRRWG